MKATRRRTRHIDALASTEGVERVLDALRASLPDLIPHSHKKLSSLLNSVRGLYSRQPTDGKHGRPSRYSREELLKVDSHLRACLARETSISVRSFVGQYLPILDFARDVRESLERGEVNLFEAHQLARLTAPTQKRDRLERSCSKHTFRHKDRERCCVQGSRRRSVRCASRMRPRPK